MNLGLLNHNLVVHIGTRIPLLLVLRNLIVLHSLHLLHFSPAVLSLLGHLFYIVHHIRLRQALLPGAAFLWLDSCTVTDRENLTVVLFEPAGFVGTAAGCS